MSVAAALLLTSTSLYAGFQWTIRLLVYPQFAAVPPNAFARYEGEHQRRVSIAVGPLFVFAGAAAIAAFVVRPGVWSALAAACVAGTVLVTGFAAVPLHRRLSEAFDASTHRRLLRVDSARLVLALLACGAAAGFALS